jgi:hypothetical protein
LLSDGRLRGLARAAPLAILAAACARHPPEPSAGSPPPSPRRAILVSFDALNERRAVETLPSDAIPAFRALFSEGACAEHAVPAWPSKTAASHASLWTGAYGDVNGVAANWQPPLPRDRHAITEGVSGYRADALRAEPIWVTAALAGRSVVAHHPTQAPGAPGYAPAHSRRADGLLDAARTAAERALRDPKAIVLNGYNRLHGPDRAITERTSPPSPAIGWRNLEHLGPTVPPKEIAWAVDGGDSVFALIFGRGTYRSVLLAPARDAATGVVAQIAPLERGSARSRRLARHFSEALPLDVGAGRIHLRIRVFALAPDGSRFLIFQPAPSVVESNHAAAARAYADAIGGWVGNGAQDLLIGGAFGPTLQDGGDGTAELRYLETLELVTRQFMLGSEWAWAKRPDLMIDYFRPRTRWITCGMASCRGNRPRSGSRSPRPSVRCAHAPGSSSTFDSKAFGDSSSPTAVPRCSCRETTACGRRGASSARTWGSRRQGSSVWTTRGGWSPRARVPTRPTACMSR